MPTYEYRCAQCLTIHSEVRRIGSRNRPRYCDCGTFGRVRCERILTVPHTAAWNEKEIFPNLDKLEDLGGIPGGKRFSSRSEYDNYLTDNGVCEIGGAHVSPGPRKIKRYGKRDTQPVSPRGAW